MRYMLLVYSSESAWTKEQWQACTVESSKVCQDLQSKGQFLAAAPLHPVASAATIRVRQSTQRLTTGPFAETAEQLGGFFLIDVESLDDAIAVAARLPAASKGTVEIRPVFELAGLPNEDFSLLQNRDVQALRYMLLCYDDAGAWKQVDSSELDNAMSQATDLAHRISQRGQYVSASPLRPIETASSVRIRQGKRLVTDGPFAETREFLGGYYLIQARDLNDAINVAAQHPGVKFGAVEVRQVFDLPEND